MIKRFKKRIVFYNKNVSYIITSIYKFDKQFALLFLIYTIISSLTPFILIIMPKYLIDELLNQRRFFYLLVIVILIVGLSFLFEVLVDTLNCRIDKYIDRFEQYFQYNISYKVSQLDFLDLERDDILRMKENALNGIDMAGGITGLINNISSAFCSILKILGLVYILYIVNPLLVFILVLLVLINWRIDKKKQEMQYAFWANNSDNNRRQSYFSSLVRDYSFSKEIRLFGMSDFLLKKYRQADKMSNDFLRKISSLEFGFSKSANLLSGLQIILIYSCMLFELIKDTTSFSVGSFVMCSRAIKEFSDSLSLLLASILRIEFSCQYFDEYRKFVNWPCFMRGGKRKIKIDNKCKIEFINVWFRYPGCDDYVIKDLSIELPCNKKIAIVGQNGAGKTTFIKLLLRLYDPTKGSIKIGGVDIKQIDYDYYMGLFSTVFQDYSIFAFSVIENILFDRLDRDESLLKRINEYGMLDRYYQLPDALDTIITKEFDENGVNFSGGELQNIAFARALVKDSNFFVFDEPTASMDPIAESNIYDLINRNIKDRMVLFISHRLASCKFCDLILVFEDGRIIQKGTHERLMDEKSGKYYKLFDTQAKYYSM